MAYLTVPTITEFIKNLIYHGLEYYRRYYGVYYATVTANNDPEERGRIQAYADGIQDSAPDVWIDPAMPGAGTGRGVFWPPEVGDGVRIAFDRGDPGLPVVYWGGWYGRTELPNEPGMSFAYSDSGHPEKRGFRTRAGHMAIVSDEPGKEFVRIVWHKPASPPENRADTADMTSGDFALIELNQDGSILMANKNGSRISMDAENSNISAVCENGNSVTLDDDGIKLVDKDGNLITLDGGDATIVAKGNLNITCKSVNLKSGGVFLADNAVLSAVLGEPLVAWLASHTHTATGPTGPTTPPVVPPTNTILSKNVKVK